MPIYRITLAQYSSVLIRAENKGEALDLRSEMHDEEWSDGEYVLDEVEELGTEEAEQEARFALDADELRARRAAYDAERATKVSSVTEKD